MLIFVYIDICIQFFLYLYDLVYIWNQSFLFTILVIIWMHVGDDLYIFLFLVQTCRYNQALLKNPLNIPRFCILK